MEPPSITGATESVESDEQLIDSTMDETRREPLPLPVGPIEISPQFYRLDARNVQVSLIIGIILLSILTLGALVGIFLLWLAIGINWIWWGVAGLVLLFGSVLWTLACVYPSLEHRHASWRLDQEGFEIHRGVWWRHRITVPLGRVQHADVVQGPIQRIFELGSLVINTAGTQGASITLEGLSPCQGLGVARFDCSAKER